jgi:hypothetical protein
MSSQRSARSAPRKLAASVSLATPEGGCIDAFLSPPDDTLGDVLLFMLGADRGDHGGRSPALAAALGALDAIARRLDVLSRAADTVRMDAVILTQMGEIERYACAARIVAEHLEAADAHDEAHCNCGDCGDCENRREAASSHDELANEAAE